MFTASGLRGALVCGVMAVGAGMLGVSTADAQTVTTVIGPGPVTFFSGSSGRISSVVCSPTNPSRYFVGTADGGVWRTTDAGVTWTALTDSMPTTAIGALALDPQDENTIYAGSGEANFANHCRYGLGLYRSGDGGDTWTVLGASTFSGRSISRVIVDPANRNVIYVAVVGAGGGPERRAAKGHPQRFGPVGVFRTADGGVTWTQLLNGLPNVAVTDLEMDPTNPNVLIAGVGEPYGDAANGLYQTNNGGASWTRLTPTGFPTTDVGRIALAWARSDRTRIYAFVATPSTGLGVGGSSAGGGALRAALRSSDAGANWTSVPVAANLVGAQAFYDLLVTVSPTNPDLVYFGGINLVRSTNGGTTLTSVNPGHVDLHAAAWDAAGRLVFGNDGGCYRANTPATATVAVPLNGTGGAGSITNMQFYAGLSTSPVSDVTIFGGLQDNGSVRRRATNTTQWDSTVGGDGGWTRVNPANPNIVFNQFQGANNLYRSTDGGVNFSFINGTGLTGRHAFLPPYLIDPTNPNRMILALERVWESTNGGNTFTPISPDLTLGGIAAIRAMAMAPSNPLFVYAATSDGLVWASSDGGRNFTQRLSGNPGWPRVTRELTVHPTQPQTVYRAVANFGVNQVQRSRDAGVTWEVLDGNLPDLPVNVVDVDLRYPTPRLYAGTDAGVYESRDDGTTWARYGTNQANAAVIDLIIEPARGRLIAAAQGRSAWIIPIYCPADYNEDGTADFFDYLDFVSAFAAEDAAADFNRDGVVDFFDYLDFVAAFAGSC